MLGCRVAIHARLLGKSFPGASDMFTQCRDRRQTVNLVSAGGLVEQSNAAKNNAVDKLAGSAAGRLAGWLAAGVLARWLAGLLCCGCWLAGSLPGWLDAAVSWLPACLLLAGRFWLTANAD